MRQQNEATAPPGWEVASEVDSRLEGDLVVRMLAARNIEAVVIPRGATDYAVFVAGDNRERAKAALDVS